MTVQFGLASVFERAVALVVDMIVITLSCLILWWMQILFVPDFTNLNYFTVIPILAFYSLGFEYLNNGQSLGKALLRIRVIRLDGDPITFKDYAMRWIFRGLDLYFSFGGIALLSVISSNYSQRIGDLLANTVVVNIGKNERMKLENLLRLNKMGEYEVRYPQVARMSEDHMLIVKETITRYVEHRNAAHEEAMELLVKKLADQLELKTPADGLGFLRTLLKDYIVLTR